MHKLQLSVHGGVAGRKCERVLLSASQAAGFIVGSTVSVGDMGAQSNKDRWNAWMRNLADLVKVSSIEK